jgi:hypothetical protein
MKQSRGWRPQDVVLAIVVLPFGVAFYLVDRLIMGVSWLTDGLSSAARGLTSARHHAAA